jgi:5-deoxy-glucuronate isomerase
MPLPDSSPKVLSAGWTRVDPDVAGWTYVSFHILEIAAGESVTLAANDQERALVPLAGRVRAQATGTEGTEGSQEQEWEFGGRENVFAGLGWCLYLPFGTTVTLTALTDVELAVAEAPSTTHHAPVLVTPDDTKIELRGGGNASRQVNSLMLPDFPADRLLVIEVWTPGGNWSSFPPHKHEHDQVTDAGAEAELEETYYYRLRDPENGWAVQRVYSPERDFDLTVSVRDGDILLIPWGYHTTAAIHGHDLYYLNVLAGPAPRRTLQAFQDPCLRQTQDAWPELGLDSRLPIVPRHPGEPLGVEGD